MFLFFSKRAREIEARLHSQGLELANRETEHNIKLKDVRAALEREMKDKESAHNREVANLKADLQRQSDILKKEHDIKLQEILSLTKLESEQKITKAILDADKRVIDLTATHTKAMEELKTAHASKISDVQQEASKKAYDLVTKELSNITTNGSDQANKIHDLSMKLLEMARPGVNESRLLTGSINDGKFTSTTRSGNKPATIVTTV